MAAEGQQPMRASEGRDATSQWASGVRAKEFEAQVERAALDRGPKADSERVTAITTRAYAYEAAYVAAKQPALAALSREGDESTVVRRRLEELNKRDVEPVPAKSVKQWATVDADDFKRIQNPRQLEDAAAVMADNGRHNKAYKAELSARAPDVAHQVEQLDSANASKVAAKDERKQEEGRAYERERAEIAKQWTPEIAAMRAAEHAKAVREQKDSTERHFALQDIATAARNNHAYRKALANDAPDVAKAVDRLERQSERAAPEAKPAEPQRTAPTSKAATNSVGSDEVFTAENAQNKTAMPSEIAQRYVKAGAKYYEDEKKTVVAFEDKGNKLETSSNTEQRAQELVRIALARGWDEIKVDGNENFRRAAWVEAASRGMHVKGYTPSEQDKAEVAKRTGERNTVEQTATGFRGRENGGDAEASKRADAFMTKSQAEAIKAHPELAGAFGKLQLVDAMMAADAKADPRLNDKSTRDAVQQFAKRRIGEQIASGELPETQVKTDFEMARKVEKEREVSR